MIENEKKFNIKLLDKILNKFKINRKNLHIYIEALTHPTYSNERHLNYNYQKLEFLGDAAISWIVSNFLYKKDLDESQMSLYKSNIVKGSVLAKLARDEFQLEELVLKGNGLTIVTDKILEDLFESFIGAIYKDQGIKKVQQILDSTIIKKFNENLINVDKSYKTKIQEFFMKNESKNHNKNPNNKIEYLASQLNDGKWFVELKFQNIIYGQGIGQTKQKAEEAAAKEACEKIAEPKIYN